MRLFVAVWPSPEVLRQLQGLRRPALESVRWTTMDQWHVTLRFLGQQPPESLGPVGVALGRAAGRLPGPIPVELGPSTARLGPGVLCLPATGLDQLAARVAEELAAAGVEPAGRAEADGPFRGHLTLARARRRSKVPASLVGLPFRGRWPVEEVCLVSSTTAPGGARYRTVLREAVVD